MMHGVFTFLATMAASSASAQLSPVPVPPAPPPLKSGSFSCDMHDAGANPFQLSGIVGDWNSLDRGSKVTFLVTAPEEFQLSGRFKGTLDPGREGFFGYESETRTSIQANLNAGRASSGTIMIERNIIGRPNSDFFVGICSFQLSEQFRELPK